MQRSKQILTTVIALPLLISSFSALASKHNIRSNSSHTMKILLKGVELTNEQKDQIKTLRKENRQERRENWLENKIIKLEQRQKSQELILADSFDESAVRTLAKEISEQQSENRLKNMRNQHELLSLLTPEQKEQARQNMQQHIEKAQEKIAKYNQ